MTRQEQVRILSSARAIKWRRFIALLGLVCLLPLSSCTSKPPPDAWTILEAMCAADPNLPAGAIRTCGAGLAEEETQLATPKQLTDALFSALYGRESVGWFSPTQRPDGSIAPPVVDQAAVFLASIPHPCEITVLRCTDPAGIVAATKQCQARLELIRHAWLGADLEDVAQSGCVTTIGNYVLLIVSATPEDLLRTARSLIP